MLDRIVERVLDNLLPLVSVMVTLLIATGRGFWYGIENRAAQRAADRDKLEERSDVLFNRVDGELLHCYDRVEKLVSALRDAENSRDKIRALAYAWEHEARIRHIAGERFVPDRWDFPVLPAFEELAH